MNFQISRPAKPRSRSGMAALAVGIASLFLFAIGSFAGEARYVSTTGNDDGPGTKSVPWRTIQKACDDLQPGETALIQAGIYHEQVYVEVEGNAEDGPITLQAEGKVILSAQGLDEDNVIYIEDKSFIRIIGLEICDLKTKDGSGIRFEGSGSNLEFRGNLIHAIRGKSAMGITVYGTNSETPVSNLIIDGNEIHDCDAAPSEALTLNGNVANFEVTNNYVHDIRGVGIDFIGGEKGIVKDRTKAARNGVCRGNRVERVRANYGGGYGPGIYVDGGHDIVVEGNFVSECDLGIEIGAENPGVVVENISVIGNVIVGNDKAGLVVGGYDSKRGRVTKSQFFNNLIRGNTTHAKAEAELWIQWAEQNSFRNNIIVGVAGSKKPLLYSENKDQPNSLDFNLWHRSDEKMEFVWSGQEFSDFSAYRRDSGVDPHSISADPKLAADGFHLEATSPAIDAGDPAMTAGEKSVDIDKEPRIKNARIDIGPDEK